jgi:hypothetical protein
LWTLALSANPPEPEPTAEVSAVRAVKAVIAVGSRSAVATFATSEYYTAVTASISTAPSGASEVVRDFAVASTATIIIADVTVNMITFAIITHAKIPYILTTVPTPPSFTAPSF